MILFTRESKKDKSNLGCQGPGVGTVDWQGHREIFQGGGIHLYLDFDGTQGSVYVCQNSMTCTLKIGVFVIRNYASIKLI